MRKRLLSLILLLLTGLTAAQAQAYDFSAVAPTGQTLYYTINTGTNTVAVTAPVNSRPGPYWDGYWEGYTKPTGALTIPSSVTYGDTTYSVTTIRSDAFINCSSLSSVTIPNSVTWIGYSAFCGCTSLSSVTIPNSVTTIEDDAFLYCSSLASVTIPNSVTWIGHGAFYGCISLAAVTIPDSVILIGNGAFCQCTSLAVVSIGSSTRWICDTAFLNCTSLSSVTIPNSVTWIGKGSFRGCTSLDSITIPNSVTTIGDCAFCGCTGLRSVNYNADSCLSYGYSVFGGCTNVSSLSIGRGVKCLPPFFGQRFYGGTYYVSDLLSVSTLFYNAENCSQHNGISQSGGCLRTLQLGNEVRMIPVGLFSGCDSITAIYLDPDSNQIASIGANAFNGCSNMAGHIVVPHITELGDGAFSGCAMLSSVELGNGLSSIGDSVFKGCDHLTNVTLGRGVQRIADNAFEGCTEIRLLTSRALNPPTIYRTTFEDVDDDISLRVPCEAVAAYQNAPFWSHFNNIEGRFDFFFSATSADITMGSVTIVHAPVCDDIEAHIQANPYHNYRFSHWSDGNTDNPRYIVVTQDTIITAIFESTEGIDALRPQIGNAYAADGRRIVVKGTAGQRVRVFDMMGRMVAARNEATEEQHFHLATAGVYLVQVGDGAAQRVVVW